MTELGSLGSPEHHPAPPTHSSEFDTEASVEILAPSPVSIDRLVVVREPLGDLALELALQGSKGPERECPQPPRGCPAETSAGSVMDVAPTTKTITHTRGELFGGSNTKSFTFAETPLHPNFPDSKTKLTLVKPGTGAAKQLTQADERRAAREERAGRASGRSTRGEARESREPSIPEEVPEEYAALFSRQNLVEISNSIREGIQRAVRDIKELEDLEGPLPKERFDEVKNNVKEDILMRILPPDVPDEVLKQLSLALYELSK